MLASCAKRINAKPRKPVAVAKTQSGFHRRAREAKAVLLVLISGRWIFRLPRAWLFNLRRFVFTSLSTYAKQKTSRGPAFRFIIFPSLISKINHLKVT